MSNLKSAESVEKLQKIRHNKILKEIFKNNPSVPKESKKNIKNRILSTTIITLGMTALFFIPILYLNRYIGGSTRQLPVTEHVN